MHWHELSLLVKLVKYGHKVFLFPSCVLFLYCQNSKHFWNKTIFGESETNLNKHIFKISSRIFTTWENFMAEWIPALDTWDSNTPQRNITGALWWSPGRQLLPWRKAVLYNLEGRNCKSKKYNYSFKFF